MSDAEKIKDLELQLSVMRELYSECSSLKDGMNDRLKAIHDRLTSAAVPMLDGTLMSRTKWLIARMMPADDRV